MPRPSLTVVVPAYNQGPFLDETIRSLLAQDDPPDHLIVSDNYSTDETPNILSGYKDRLTVISPPAHLPACEHGDFLIAQAPTEWVALLSSDDVARPDYVRRFRDALARDGEHAVLCRGGVQLIDNDSRLIADRPLLSVGRRDSGPVAFRDQLENPKVYFANFCIRKSAFHAVGGFKNYEAAGDWPLWLELCAHGSFLRIDGTTSRYRINQRPGLFKKRLPGEIRDEWRIRSDVIPRVEQALGLSLPPRLQLRIARRRLIQRLNACLAEGVTDAEESLAQTINEWADFCDSHDVVECFRSGARAQEEIPLAMRLRQRFTPLGRRLLTALRPQ